MRERAARTTTMSGAAAQWLSARLDCDRAVWPPGNWLGLEKRHSTEQKSTVRIGLTANTDSSSDRGGVRTQVERDAMPPSFAT